MVDLVTDMFVAYIVMTVPLEEAWKQYSHLRMFESGYHFYYYSKVKTLLIAKYERLSTIRESWEL